MAENRSLIFDGDYDNDVELASYDVKKKLLPELDDGKLALPVNQDHNHVKVFLRIRPFSREELESNENKGCMEVENERSLLVKAPRDSHTFRVVAYGLNKQYQRFSFSRIFAEKTSQKQFFDDTMLSTVRNFIDGQNCLVFTYGVTNSGKTYTIHGDVKDGGILPRSLDVVFNSIEGMQYDRHNLKPDMFCDVLHLTADQERAEIAQKEAILSLLSQSDKAVSSSVSSTTSSLNNVSHSPPLNDCEDDDDIGKVVASRKRDMTQVDVQSQGPICYCIYVSYAEIYNDQIFDLLAPLPKTKNVRRAVLQLREDKHGRPYVKGLKEVQVSTADEAYRVLTIGKRNLQFACTKLSQLSSRSHCIFTVKMLRLVNKNEPHVARVSMLSFCDLAGSERCQKTQGFGERLKEAGNINSSLLTLGRCIKTLLNNQANRCRDPQIVPFRECRLTRLFQSFFAGQGCASMIVNVSQCASVFDETLYAIKYSAIAQQVVIAQSQLEHVETKPKILSKEASALDTKRADHQEVAKVPDHNSIGWASPGTYERMIDSGQLSISLALSSTDENSFTMSDFLEPSSDADDDSTMTMISVSSDTQTQTAEMRQKKQLWQDERTTMLNAIKILEEKLVEAARSSSTLEARIRDEVCEEMKKQFVEIENSYQESLRMREEMQEQKYEKKMAILVKAMEKSRKRQRLSDGCDDLAPSVILHAEQVKIKQLEERVQALDQQNQYLEELTESWKTVCHERQLAVEQVTKLQFQLAIVQARLRTAQDKLNDQKTDPSSSNCSAKS